MSCAICPRDCHALRSLHQGEGYCRAGTLPLVAHVRRHMWEEPCISGSRGSGTVFFSGCALGCVYCQNYAISHRLMGKSHTARELAALFMRLAETGVHNINLVNPTHFTPAIAEALEIARLPIPVVWNSSGYERADTLRTLDGLVQIYLPDLKHISPDIARICANAPDYSAHAQTALLEMNRQHGAPVYDEHGLMTSGLMVRHLVLPGCTSDSINVLNFIAESLPEGTPVSLMGQYTPYGQAKEISGLDRILTAREYRRVISHMQALSLPGYCQKQGAADETFIPDFSDDPLGIL